MGRSVVVTRAPTQSARFADALRAYGATPIFLPTIRIAPPADGAALAEAARHIHSYSLVVLGSVNAASALAAALKSQGQRCAAPIACVGSKTAQALRAHTQLREVLQGELLCPEVYRAEALVAEVQLRFADRGGMVGLKVLHPRAAQGREIVQERLTDFGAAVDAVEAYRIVPAAPPNPETLALAQQADAVTFLSGQTMSAWNSVLPSAMAQDILRQAVVAVIGPVAAERAAALGVRVDVVPERATSEDLIQALDAHFLKR